MPNGYLGLTQNAIRHLKIDANDTEFVNLQRIKTISLGKAEKRELDPKTAQYIQNRNILAKSAAAIVIQSFIRGWLTQRKYVAIVNFGISTLRMGKTPGAEHLPQVDDLSLQDSMIVKYERYCTFRQKQRETFPQFPDFCAALISATWKGYLVRTLYQSFKEKIETVEPAEKRKIESWIKNQIDIRGTLRVSEHNAALLIQKIWKAHYNKRIYKFYRDLIRFREQGNPRTLLRHINPKEAALLDCFFDLHSVFPPNIVYKIFVTKNLIDMNAFSPRKYHELKEPTLSERFNKSAKPPEEIEEWYERNDNNYWRPVLESQLLSHEQQVVFSKPKKFHYSLQKRQERTNLRARNTGEAWIQKIDQLLEQDHVWIDWSRDLDFSKYQEQWSLLATTTQIPKKNGLKGEYGL